MLRPSRRGDGRVRSNRSSRLPRNWKARRPRNSGGKDRLRHVILGADTGRAPPRADVRATSGTHGYSWVTYPCRRPGRWWPGSSRLGARTSNGGARIAVAGSRKCPKAGTGLAHSALLENGYALLHSAAMRWKIGCAINSCKAPMPFQERLRAWKRAQVGYVTDPRRIVPRSSVDSTRSGWSRNSATRPRHRCSSRILDGKRSSQFCFRWPAHHKFTRQA